MNTSDQTTKTAAPSAAGRLDTLRRWWTTAWAKGGFLDRRWEEIRQIRESDWHTVANWLKAVLLVATACVGIILIETAIDILGALYGQIASATPTTRAANALLADLWGVIDTPVRRYITDHSTGLTASGSVIYALWQAAGFLGLVGGFLRFTTARLVWTIWGALTIAAVWLATPTASRPLALAVALTAWSLASLFALRGLALSLRPVIYNAPTQPVIEVRPEIHIPAPTDGTTPDNVHPLQR
ncbi:hypothetical protein [Streptomyces roseolus]